MLLRMEKMEWSMTVTTNPDAHYVLKTCELKGLQK